MSRVGLGIAGAGLGLAGWYMWPQKQPKNMAFVFVKPNQVNEKVIKTVRDGMIAKGIKITREGDISSEVIDKKKLVDQHYYAIASKATILKPSELNVDNEKFQKKFGVAWSDVLAKGSAFNALDACQELGCSSDELEIAGRNAEKLGNTVKLGGGFYCTLLEMPGKKPIYVFNAFFMKMRSQYTAPGRQLHYFSVEWEEADLSWADFRGKLLGPTNPKDAPADSLRGSVYRTWKDHGLTSEPDVGNNVVHASASPFEGMCERMNWLETPCRKDAYCRSLVNAGIREALIKEWSCDPQVRLNGRGKLGSVWDALEDKDATACTKEAKYLQNLQPTNVEPQCPMPAWLVGPFIGDKKRKFTGTHM